VHTEVLTDGVMDLMISGVVNNVEKALVRTKTATSFALGTRRLYDFVDSNPVVEFLPVSWVNNPVRDPIHSLERALSVVLSFNSTHSSLGLSPPRSLIQLSRLLVDSLVTHLLTILCTFTLPATHLTSSSTARTSPIPPTHVDQVFIGRMKNMISINSTLEVDLVGQCASESIGPVFYSGAQQQ
jgi:acyl-CoA hydrolase